MAGNVKKIGALTAKEHYLELPVLTASIAAKSCHPGVPALAGQRPREQTCSAGVSRRLYSK